ncbi:DHA2 family efflux MFS transporter permease subunit [Paraburkholderia edwinii]|jgi:EmrB/QacA subfamily drug resistance transporter|uniref:DHA2 family efflux MFS transporter permease subunit n=1 Tax=Paraburkholderia edwinii TaxID=2861782 RepID=A0ABX8UST0_9BURK|nr:DHA2 family efflux MFS transporter permease subunit [Paraburkholderia edwinii]QYD70407.1 DHA2 family efflux MFS transporter permease subunit [Paraburkholderia edwinii]
MTDRARLIPIIVACPLLLQNLDTSIMATALPSIAHSLAVEPLHLNLAITSYLLSLAVFLPASGWLADRFGTRRIFCTAIVLFSVGSTLCGLATSLSQLVLFRVIQGMGGAMMVPVGRLILLRSVPPARMVAAMVWFTVPGAVGRLAGPLLGGLVVTVASWRWIFLLNVPFGVIGVICALAFIEDTQEPHDARFDLPGFLLLSVGLVGMVGGFETAGRGLVAQPVTLALIGTGALALVAYWFYTRRHPEPIIDPGLLRYHAYRTAVVGGMPLRIALGASPFLLPLMLQLGFGLSPLASGSISVATAVGSLSVRALMGPAIRGIGFRRLLIGATLVTGCFYASYGLFSPATPHALIFVVLLFGGLFNSLAMVTLNTLGYSDMPKPQMSRATALASMAQQLSISVGVAFAASLLALTAYLNGGSAMQLSARDFSPAFFVVGALTLCSLLFFVKLSHDEGSELRQR